MKGILSAQSRQRVPWGIAVPVFMATVVIHILTFLGIRLSNGAQAAVLLSLFSGTFLVFVAMMLDQQFTSSDSDLTTDRKSNPCALRLMICLTIYAAVNFLVCLRLLESGSPELTAAGYILSNHGKFVRSLTEVEYWKMRAYELRLFTGHFLVFSGWPMFYFFTVNNRPVQEAVPF